MNAEEPVHVCIDRVVPAQYQPARATSQRAALERASRQPAAAALADLDPGAVVVEKAAMTLAKKWPNGTHLKCRFLDGDDTQRAKVREHARVWETYANIHIDFVESTDEQVRISFVADPGSWSAVGTDCLIESYFPRYQPTMNFGWLVDATPDEEYERVVVHEFGHALGLVHEHQSPAEKLDWNVPEVYRVFSGPPNNWSKEDIDHNILEHYGPKGMKFTDFDRTSIMLYQFPKKLFNSGEGTALNEHLSEEDKQFIAGVYPNGV